MKFLNETARLLLNENMQRIGRLARTIGNYASVCAPAAYIITGESGYTIIINQHHDFIIPISDSENTKKLKPKGPDAYLLP